MYKRLVKLCIIIFSLSLSFQIAAKDLYAPGNSGKGTKDDPFNEKQ